MRNTVQAYLDEKPLWSDGTLAPASPMTSMQQRIWWLSVAGKFFKVAGLHDRRGAAADRQGIRPFGRIIRHGWCGQPVRHPDRSECVGLASATVSAASRCSSSRWRCSWCFWCDPVHAKLRLAGGLPVRDGPCARLRLSYRPSGDFREHAVAQPGTLVLAAFGFQAAGALVGTAVGYVVLNADPSLPAWRWMYGTAMIPPAWCCSAASL